MDEILKAGKVWRDERSKEKPDWKALADAESRLSRALAELD